MNSLPELLLESRALELMENVWQASQNAGQLLDKMLAIK
jgi:hypothetical protein